MISLTTGQLEGWLVQLLWPFIRVGACFMVAPAFGAQFIPPRIRIVLAGAVAMIISPLITMPTDITVFSATGILITLQQIIIGIAIGFSLQLLFDAVTLGGQLLANSMGLSFAFNTDPMHGVQTPVLGQIYNMLVMLTFLALNGHLKLIEVLVDVETEGLLRSVGGDLLRGCGCGGHSGSESEDGEFLHRWKSS